MADAGRLASGVAAVAGAPWGVSGAIWTVMTQVSHVQEDCQRPPSGDDEDDYFRWQARPRLQP